MRKAFILAACCMALFSCGDKKKDEKKTEDGKTTVSATGKKPPTEILDLSAADPISKSLAAFSKGDVDGMTADYDDNIKYTWSGGDSAIGKQAIKDYYSGRLKLIESIDFSKDIKLP